MKLVSLTILLSAGLVLLPTGHAPALASPDHPVASLAALQPPSAPLGSDPLAQIDAYLAQVQQQVQEMVRVAQQGGVPGEALLNQLQTNLNNALHLAASLSDADLGAWLNRAHAMVQEQRQALYQAQTGLGGAQVEPLRQAYLYMSQVQLQLQAGQQTAQLFRQAYAGTCDDCQPQGDQHQYGPQPEQPGPGQPGGNPDGTCDDCQPQGDQHQYGPQPEQPGGNPDDGGGNHDADQGKAAGGGRRGQ